MLGKRHPRSGFRLGSLTIATALSLSVLSVERGLAQQTGDATFRLLTFEVAESGPRLGTTRGTGDQDIIDMHNAITYLYRADAPEVQTLPAIPIDMRSLIEAGDVPIQAVRSLHDTMTRIRTAGNFEEPGGSQRVFHPSASVGYLPPIPNPSKLMSLAGAYQRRQADGTPGSYDDAEYPSFFFKSPASLTGHETNINLWGLLTRGVYEPEFAFVIGKTARAVPASEALDYVVGYTMMNDVSSRDLPQGSHGQQGGVHEQVVGHVYPAWPIPHPEGGRLEPKRYECRRSGGWGAPRMAHTERKHIVSQLQRGADDRLPQRAHDAPTGRCDRNRSAAAQHVFCRGAGRRGDNREPRDTAE